MGSQSNTTSHEPLFNIIDSFLEKVSFETSMEYFSTSEPNYVTHTFVELDEKFGSHNHYMVKIHTDIALMVEGEYTAFRLSVVFAAFVEVYGNHHEEMELHDILNYDVPQKLLNRIRTLVFQIIRESGYQYMPGDDTFSRPTHLDNENQVFMPLVPMPEGESDSKKETDQVFVPLPAFLKDEFDDEDDYEAEKEDTHRYRYAAWKNKDDMMDVPNVIIENGYYDGNLSCYVFENNGYKYEVYPEQIKVYENDKIILEQQLRELTSPANEK